MLTRKHIALAAAGIFCAVLAALLVLQAPLAAQGAREGIALCGQVIIPSLYPFLVLGGIFSCLGTGRRKAGRGKLLQLLFRQPPAALGAIFLGLLGGYPMGARAAAQLMERGALTQAQAQRLQLFCVNAGPAYLMGAVGSALLGSRRAGLLLFVSLTSASLVMALLSRFWEPDACDQIPAEKNPAGGKPMPLDHIILTSVTQATGAIVGICAWVVLFSTLCALLRLLPHSLWPAIPAMNVFLEVSSGVNAIIREGAALPVICAALGWGGLAVHCQVLGDVRKTGLPLRIFWVSRALHGSIAAAICWQLMRWFPAGLPTAAMANGLHSVKLWAVSAPAAAAILFFCAFLILDLDLNRKV